AVEFATNANVANFELRLYENSDRFDVVYGTLTSSGSSATVGVQKASGAGSQFTQYECNTGGLSAGLQLIFTEPPCVTPTPTPPACKPLLVGHVTLQGIGQPNDHNVLKPLTLTLKMNPNAGVDIPVTLDARGVYTVN